MSSLYLVAKMGFLRGQINWESNTFRVLALSNGYKPNFINDTAVSAVPSAAIVARSAALTGQSAANGVAQAANTSFTSVSGPGIIALMVYKDFNNDTLSIPIVYIDSGRSLPAVPSGGNMTVSWDTQSGIFSL